MAREQQSNVVIVTPVQNLLIVAPPIFRKVIGVLLYVVAIACNTKGSVLTGAGEKSGFGEADSCAAWNAHLYYSSCVNEHAHDQE